MNKLKSILLPLILLTCIIKTDAQEIRMYKTDGTTITISHTVLDSIVSIADEDVYKVNRSDGRVLKVLFSELDSIVAVGGYDTDMDFVDLGLSVMWASRNIGAEKAEDHGYYFAWGEVSGKTTYTKDNSVTRGKKLNTITGNKEYDAARKNWGEPARIPTFEEFNELRDKCIWQWTTINDVDGQLVTGPNGNSIFLPAAGVCRGDSLDDFCEKGNYWTATSYEGDNVNAYNTIFNSSGYWGSMHPRNDGLSVRAVSGSIQCLSYTGDTVRVGEYEADVEVVFTYVPSAGIKGGIEYTSATSGIKQERIIEVKKDGEYVITLDGLERGTKYKYRSFVIEDDRHLYGKTEEFVTKNSEDNLTKGTWVDLGLSVKWASRNIGAAKPEDYGDYYAWGEIYPKQLYDETNSQTLGKKMSDISGDGEYDVARASWGGESRIPNESEINELFEKCTWEWTPRNGVNGMLVTGPNGNCIFIPASGLRMGAVLDGDDRNGFYWSSTPKNDDDDRAYSIMFSKKGPRGSWSSRANGRVIRAVSK